MLRVRENINSSLDVATFNSSKIGPRLAAEGHVDSTTVVQAPVRHFCLNPQPVPHVMDACPVRPVTCQWTRQENPRLRLIQAEPWWRASIWRSHRKVVIKQCSYHNNIIDIQNRLPYSKVVYPAIIVLFPCVMEVNHGVRTGPDYPFR